MRCPTCGEDYSKCTCIMLGTSRVRFNVNLEPPKIYIPNACQPPVCGYCHTRCGGTCNMRIVNGNDPHNPGGL